ncbi:CheY-like protein [Glarea lozoyensis ATCC 20868]|uniref:CheY-like protein n=1 Tax=Glarea lozoyensis (strain ATCC 20868 / MF5171) TaxID=1116229 RepID=S3DGN6_GLAL2|nr:CheY-like protein [Glarea lozoyensis ATCC 20868]EPE31201.1 CheY-like protein [Glarea lozoyensis ATCC 20868]
MDLASESPSQSETLTGHSLIALTPIPTVLLDASLHILLVSASFLSLHNLAAEACIGVGVYELMGARGLGLDVASVQCAIETARSTKKVHAADAIQVKGHGTAAPRYWAVRAIPMFEKETLRYISIEFQETISDDQMQQANNQLDTNDTYRMLVQTVKDYAIFMLDTKGNVKTWNQGAALLKGYTAEEIIGKHFSTFYTREDLVAEKPRKEIEICLRDGKVEDESWRLRRDGSRFWANVILTSVYRNGVHIGFSKVTRDLTERKAAESRLVSAYEEAAKLKSEFLANMTHEIRTPMHGMLSALTLLTDTSLLPEQRELTGIIEESGNVLLDVINDILDWSKLSAGTFPINSDVINIPDVVSSVVRGSRPLLNHGVSIDVSSDPSLPTVVHGDPVRYRQVLNNLVSNAAKFTDSGSIRIRTYATKEDDLSYILQTEVTDTGIGISNPTSGSLFTPFTQFDTSATKRYKGTGLGLSISKTLAELMGGTIGFHANPQTRGSVFWFSVNVAKLPTTIPAAVLTKALASTTISPVDPRELLSEIAPSKRLLLAEDNLINQKVMVKMLRGLGFEHIHTALDGAQAVQLAKQHSLLLDVILMDISMPILDGMEATVEIRRAGVNIPIIALTANALEGDREIYLAKGMNGYVSKPVDRQKLADVLLRWLKCD